MADTGGITGELGKKVGPLPLGAYVAVGVGLLAWWMYKNGGSITPNSSTAASPTGLVNSSQLAYPMPTSSDINVTVSQPAGPNLPTTSAPSPGGWIPPTGRPGYTFPTGPTPGGASLHRLAYAVQPGSTPATLTAPAATAGVVGPATVTRTQPMVIPR